MDVVIVVIVLIVLAAAAGIFVTSKLRGPRAKTVVIDSFTLSEPWRQHVSGAQSTQRRYAATTKNAPDGPLRDRLSEIGLLVQRGVEECWQIARRGDELDDVLNRLDAPSLIAQMDRAVDDGERSSLQRQIDSAARIRTTRDDTDKRLRLLNVRLGELITQASEVSIGTDTTAELGSGVDDVVTQLEALRLAVQDINTTPGGGAVGGQSAPPS